MCCAAMKSIAVLVLWAAVVASNPTHPDCVICLRGKCLAPAAFYDNRETLEHRAMAINYIDNILYYLDYSKTVKAINLDTNSLVGIPEIDNKSKFSVDPATGGLYYYKSKQIVENQNIFTKYQIKTNETTIITVPNPENKKPPHLLWVYNGTLYFRNWEKGLLNVFDGKTLQTLPALGNITVYDIHFDGFGNMYIIGDGIRRSKEVYKLKAKENTIEKLSLLGETSDTINSDLSGSISMCSNINGDIYVVDTYNHVIYQVDPSIDKLHTIGAFQGHSGVCLLDKNNNIIFGNGMSTSYYKPTNDLCLFQNTDRKMVITKVEF